MDHGHANNSQDFALESTPVITRGNYPAPADNQPFFTAGVGNSDPSSAANLPDDINAENWQSQATSEQPAIFSTPEQSPDQNIERPQMPPLEATDRGQMGEIINLEPATTAKTHERPHSFDPNMVRPKQDGSLDSGTLGIVEDLERELSQTASPANFVDEVAKLREEYVKKRFPGRKAA